MVLPIFDRLSMTKFLIDTVAEISVLFAGAFQFSLHPVLHLYAAINIKTPVCTSKLVKLNLSRSFE